MKASRLLLLLAFIAISSLMLAVSVGSTNYGVKTLAAALVTHGAERGGAAADAGSLVRQVIFELRLPRALNAFSTGGLLALAGVLMQVLLRNPLADPYVLGISGGAAVAALGAMLLGLGGLIVDWAAGAGALGATLMVFAIGGLAIAGARTLNVLARGEIESQSLGVALSPARIALFCATAALTATAVITAGGIGFIGLVTPHLVRLVAGSNHRIVVPASILLGGSLLTLADTLARIAAAPRQLPVGALAALTGALLALSCVGTTAAWLLSRTVPAVRCRAPWQSPKEPTRIYCRNRV